VTNVLKNTLVMCLGRVFVTALSNVTVSALRQWIPSRIRMMVEVLIIACFVIVVDIVLKAYMPGISRQLGPYVGLIITNCIVMGRAEGFAMSNNVRDSFVDGVGNGLGYSVVLMAVAFFRELFGSWSLFGYQLVSDEFKREFTQGLMLQSPSAFFLIGAFIWVLRTAKPAQIEKA
jgi:Na+-transporting NADH:ubiquinone oxidoreductase subunit D